MYLPTGAQALDFRLRQIADLGGRSNACDFADLLRTGTADAVNAATDPDVLLGWQVDAAIRAMTRFSS